VSEFFLIGEYLAKLQARAWLSNALCAPGQHTAKIRRNLHETITFLLVTLPNIHQFIFLLSDSARNLSFVWSLTTPPHVKYTATLPCNLSSRACFADNNVTQGSVATYARWGEILNIHLTANLPRNLPVNFF